MLCHDCIETFSSAKVRKHFRRTPRVLKLMRNVSWNYEYQYGSVCSYTTQNYTLKSPPVVQKLYLGHNYIIYSIVIVILHVSTIRLYFEIKYFSMIYCRIIRSNFVFWKLVAMFFTLFKSSTLNIHASMRAEKKNLN